MRKHIENKQQLIFVFIILFSFNNLAISTETLTIDAGNVNGIIPAIHGTNNGPLVKAAWDPPCGNNQVGDYSQHYVNANIPQARTHGAGSLDMSQIWKPWPNYTGHDPTDPDNYNWLNADEAISAAMAVTNSYLRFGESANHGISSGGGCDSSRPTSTPPENFAVFAQVCKHIIKHFKGGWDNGFFYKINYAEVWNEFYIPGFWTGTGEQAAQLYEAVHKAIKPEFPELQLGASISLQYTQSGFMDYVQANNVAIDYIAPHSYRAMPYNMRLAVHDNPGADWESVFAYYGLPANTPIVFSEWNRPGGCYNGGNGGGLSAIPIAAHLIGTLIEMAEMHPSNSSHNVVMGHYFSAAKQIWNAQNINRSAGVALQAYGHDLYGETPIKISSTGGHSNLKDTDFLTIAGKSENNDKVNVLVSYYDTSMTNCPLDVGLGVILNLNINNLPWGNAGFRWERWVHTSTSLLTLADSGIGYGGTFSTTQNINKNAFELYKLTVLTIPLANMN
ncbi:MAG: hypothetical protein JKY19_06050 [Alcanivoracaceae bacterium]|nr:hypothetical protein [Alcanivoracaceae bacterium]